MAALLAVTGGNFDEEVKGSDLPVLLDFWAEWCAPCHMVAPVVESISEKYAGRLKVGKVNVDTEPELAGRFGIRSIPTLLVLKDGDVVQTLVGYQPEETLVKHIDEALGD